MIDAKEAVKKAVLYFNEMSQAAGRTMPAVELEEVEKSEDEQYWWVTLSYLASKTLALRGFNEMYKYKSFKVNAQTGEVVWMKNRESRVSNVLE
jgi:hypothetical protein